MQIHFSETFSPPSSSWLLKVPTDTFQVVFYEAQFFSQCVMGRFLFSTSHNERGDFMPRIIQWKLHGKVCFTLKTHQEKGTIVT